MTTLNPLLRRIPAVAGVAAIIAMGAFTASCAKEEDKAPETSTTTTTTTTTAPATTSAPPASPTGAPASPTENAPASPTENAPRLEPGGPNPFSPTVYAPPPATATPGQHRR